MPAHRADTGASAHHLQTHVCEAAWTVYNERRVDGIPLLMGRDKLRRKIQVGIVQLERGGFCDEDTVLAEVGAAIDKDEAASQDKSSM